jgi:hypothetical protein
MTPAAALGVWHAAHHPGYLSAVKMLATVRKLAVPVIVGQVNIARKQVNVLNAAIKEEGPTTPAANPA